MPLTLHTFQRHLKSCFHFLSPSCPTPEAITQLNTPYRLFLGAPGPCTPSLCLQDHACTAQRGAERRTNCGRQDVALRAPDGLCHRLDGGGGRTRTVQVKPPPLPLPSGPAYSDTRTPTPGRATVQTAPTSCSTGGCVVSFRGAAAKKSSWASTAAGIS